MDFAPEELLPTLAQYLKPGLNTSPAGHLKVRQALNDTAMDYDARTALLLEGESDVREDMDSERLWRAGQGLTGGALAAGALVRGLSLADSLANGLDGARQRSKEKLLEEALNVGKRRSADITDLVASDVSRGVGLKPAAGMSVRDLLSGPLQAQYGSRERSLTSLGQYVKDRLQSEAKLTEFNDPTVSKAMRAVLSPERSLWDQLSRRAAKGLRGASRAGLNPWARLGLATTALGTGAYLGARSMDSEPLPERTEEEALAMLRSMDRRRAMQGPGIEPPRVARSLPSKAEALMSPLRKVRPQALEDTVGTIVRDTDANAHMENPQVGTNWMSL